MKNEYYESLLQDRDRDGVIKGKSINAILKQYPFIIDGDDLPISSYKGENTHAQKSLHPGTEVKVYWLSPDLTGSGWAFLIVDGIGQQVKLIKG